MALLRTKIVEFTLTNTGNGNANTDGSLNYGYVFLNNNWYWYTGASGPIVAAAGDSVSVSYRLKTGVGFFGLGTIATPNNRNDILFGFHRMFVTISGSSSEWWCIYESGTRKYVTAVHPLAGDTLDVRVSQTGTVEYYVNNVLVYTSLVAAATVQGYALRAVVAGGYYASWDETLGDPQPSTSNSLEMAMVTFAHASAIAGGSVVGIPTVGQLFPRLTGVTSGGGALSNSRFANAILQREPLIYHRFGELAAAPTSVDEMGRVNGTYENVTKEVASLIVSDTEANTAISLNGVNSRITMGAPTVLQLQTFTILMLVKTPADFSSHWRLFDYDSSDSWANGRGIHWTIGTDGKHQLSIGNGGAYSGAASAAALAANTAYLLACSYDGATQKVYTNGSQSGSLGLVGPVSYLNATLAAIGYVYFGGNLIRWGKGTYDEFAIFPYVMSDAGHLALYKSAFNLP